MGILIGTVIFLILFIIAVLTQNMSIWGIALLSIGSVFVWYQKKAVSPKALLLMGIYAVIWGLLTLAGPYLGSDYAMCVFMEGLGGIFLMIGTYQGIIKPIVCREEVTAIYMGATHYTGSKGITRYDPIFAYRYQGTSYQGATGEAYSRRKLLKMYQEGEDYSIYVNPGNPLVIRTKRRPQGTDILLLCLGVVFVSVPLLELL